jgi:PAS domain S-box-containing protein
MRAWAPGVHGAGEVLPAAGYANADAETEAGVNFETFLTDLNAVRDRAGRFRQRADDEDLAETLVEALAELDVTLEELRVAEEEVRTQQDALSAGRERSEAEVQRYQALFLLAPAAYLVTDSAGLIREANLRAVALLGVDRRFLAGKPLASFVHAEDRWPFRDRLARLAREDMAEWQIRLHPRGGGPIPVTVSVAVGRDRGGTATQLRWLLWPPPETGPGPESIGVAAPLAVGPAAGPVTLDDLTATLREVVDATAQLVRADGAGLMVADQDGVLRWVTATGEAERAFERAQRDLDEGPCVDAFRKSEVVRSSDLRADPRWPRLAPAVAGNHIRGVLSSPVQHGGVVLGTCNAVAHTPRGWTEADVAAVAAFGAVLGRLLASTFAARHQGDLVTQLQTALESRVLIEQAKGVLMEREGLSAQAAFERLRRRARARSMRLDDLAREVIADRRLLRPGGRPES